MFNKPVMIDVFKNLLSQAKNSYDEFNAADGKIGDGDLGITILNGLEEINKNIDKFKDDLSINFMLCSQAFVKKSGSSFGTLIAFSLMNISKKMQGKTHCDHNDIINFFETALKTILERGKTNIGDKTIALHLVPSGILRKNIKCVIGNGVFFGILGRVIFAMGFFSICLFLIIHRKNLFREERRRFIVEGEGAFFLLSPSQERISYLSNSVILRSCVEIY